MRVEESAFTVARLALNERKGKIAAEDHLARAGDAVGKARGNRADAGDRQDAERDAGDKNTEAAQAAAQIAPGEAQRSKATWLGGGRQHQAAFGAMRLSTRCVGANTNSGNPINSPASQT